MSFRATSALPGLYSTLARIALSCLAAGTAFAQRGQPIEFSSPNNGLVISNLNQLGQPQSGVKQLNEDLFRSFESLNPDSSLGPLVTPPYRPPPRSAFQSKRDKEKEDRRKNWVFVDPDELSKGPSPEEIFGLKEYDEHGQEKKPLSAVEKYYQKLDRERAGAGERFDDQTADREKDGFSSLRAVDRFDPLDGDDSKSGQLLKGLFHSDLDGKSALRSTSLSGLLSDLAKGDGFQTGWDNARGERIKEFERSLGPRSDSPSLSGYLNSFSQPGDAHPSLTPARDLGVYTGPRQLDPSSLAPSGLKVGPAAISGGFLDVNARSLGQPSLSPVLQPAPPPKAQKAPNFTFPTRQF